MAEQHSFDITTGCDMQEVDNAVNQANKALAQRYDFRKVSYRLSLEREKNLLVLQAPSEFLLEAIWEVLASKLAKRGVPIANFERKDPSKAGLDSVKQDIPIIQAIDSEKAKAIVKALKAQSFKKVQPTIQAEQIRVSSPSRDELQTVIAWLDQQDFGIQLQFGNFR